MDTRPTLVSVTLPGPSTPIVPLTDKQYSDQDFCECSFCYGAYCQDEKEWLECACGRWVHEECMEDVVLGGYGQELFCPFRIN